MRIARLGNSLRIVADYVSAACYWDVLQMAAASIAAPNAALVATESMRQSSVAAAFA
ncbi:hypothetical protein [Pararobbsia alpina]|uniref:Uncharacterized protein n=1 Tax=Pararobbsia alpina TaxID=621374 RepID=A0A6S7D4D3_9BURK|nr:hypothetical protein [Pararobbsia alpina]CAB3806288.1 hypothetical protein LMG28138_05793 [Pararobbsia alpina]